MGFFSLIGASADAPLFVTCLPNTRNDPSVPIRWGRARSSDELRQFIAKHDRPGAAIYFAVAQLKDGATTRSAATVKATRWLWAEVDFKDHTDIPADEILHRLKAMPNAPTLIVSSGHGYHCYWNLREPEDLTTDDGQHRVKEALKLACAHIGGDSACAEVARLMRIPGSRNTKGGGSVAVSVIEHAPERVYDLDGLVDGFLGASPVLPESAKQAPNYRHPRDIFEQFADAFPTPRVDVAERLENMQFEGPGDSSFHVTQRATTASLLCAGVPLDEVVERVLHATKHAAARDPRCAGWHKWPEARTRIERMCLDWVSKNPDLSGCLPESIREQFDTIAAAGKRPKVVRAYGKLHVRGYAGGHANESAGGEPREDRREAPRREEPRAAGEEKPKEAPKRIEPTPYAPRDPSLIPQRKWLYGRHYLRKAVTATIAPGGSGKTSLDMTEAVAMATGRDLLGEQPTGRFRVWYFNGEDSRDEIERRLAAICIHYEIDPEELGSWLFIDSGRDMQIKVAVANGHLKLGVETVRAVAAGIQKNEIDVAIFDPLISVHSVPENNNTFMDAVIKQFALVADTCDCAVEVAQHARKLGREQEELTAADARGGSATIDAVRSARLLNRMTRDEAKRFGLENNIRQQRSIFRVDRGKFNMTAPENATWMTFVSVELPNGPGGTPGDDVGVVKRWIPPEALAGVSDQDAEAIRAQVRLGDYRQDMRAKDWVGLLVAKRLGIDPTEDGGKARIKAVIHAWVAAGVLAVEMREDDTRHTRAFVVPGPWPREQR
jgi:hypothetical protein